MATKITIPQLGESISEATIATWLKGDGEYVEKDEDIVELETDKVTMPLPAPASGALSQSVSEGDTVAVGDSIGEIDESASKSEGGEAKEKKPEKQRAEKGESAEEEEREAKAGKEEKAGKREPMSVGARAREGAGEESPEPKGYMPSKSPGAEEAGEPDGGEEGEYRTTPLAAKLASEHKVPLSEVKATGPGGRIREQDVLAYLSSHNGKGAQVSAPTAGQVPAPGGERAVRRERMSQLRQKIASRLVEAQQTAAMLTTFNECDMSKVMALRSKHKDAFQEKHGVKLGFMSFFTKAACSALKEFPVVNASIVEGEKGPEIEYHDYCDVAVAVGTEKGLVVPVLRGVDSLSFAEIESGILDLATKAREGKLTLEDLQGGTFTISNGGVYGSMLSTPILNPPQSGILGLHNIIRRPVENPDKPGSGEIEVRPMMYLALSYDHRLVDGEGAVRFLRHIKECIEDPERLLLGM